MIIIEEVAKGQSIGEESATRSIFEGNESVDKGYFGIVTYFVQIAGIMKISIYFEASDGGQNELDKLQSYLSRFLSVEISQIPLSICPFKGLDTEYKMLFRMLFLFGIYFAWVFIYITISCVFAIRKKRKDNNREQLMKGLMIRGLVEILKYTYSGFAAVTFLFMTCVKLGDNYFWKYDGNIPCLSKWQWVILGFGVIYTVPFPFALAVGIKLLRKGHVSANIFFLGCVLPLPSLCYWLLRDSQLKQDAAAPDDNVTIADKGVNTEKVSTLSDEILSVLEGPYRIYYTKLSERAQKSYLVTITSGIQMTSYWEAILVIRRLIITATSLFNNSLIQSMLNLMLCILILIQHMIIKPFKANFSNLAEIVSLISLCFVASINLIRASYTQTGTFPEGPIVDIFKTFELLENGLVIFLISFIAFGEMYIKIKKK